MGFWYKRNLIQLLNVVHLSKGQDKTDIQGTLRRVSNSIQIRGANIWILFCASLLACVGLDTNSTILLISAMLISPLMTPVLGVGIFYFTNDLQNLKLALKKVFVAVSITIFTSLMYFLITPFGQITEEISARIKPTLIDAFIAFIGGVVGIISLTRKEHTSVMPGVAVAITLMPPLCVIGYGLSKADASILFGAFYLFLINIIIICFVSSFIVRWLDFPIKKRAPKKYPKMYLRVKILGLFLLLFPGTYWFIEVISFKDQKGQVENFIDDRVRPISEVINWRIINNDSLNRVEIFTSGNIINEDSLDWLQSSFDSLNMKGLIFEIYQPDVKKVITKVNQIVDSVGQVRAKKKQPTVKEILKEAELIFDDVDRIYCKNSGRREYLVDWKGWDLTVISKKKKLHRIKEFIQLRTGMSVEVESS